MHEYNLLAQWVDLVKIYGRESCQAEEFLKLHGDNESLMVLVRTAEDLRDLFRTRNR